ncbi:MAG: SpoIIE family protein phosphatase [Phycisphaerales bacterium]|nr:SpoIIE family protein phosphatase [Phycisphaerales bacterium]
MALAAPVVTLRPLLRIQAGEPIRPLRLGSTSGRLVIGRTAGAGWAIPEPTVSRRHAMLEPAGGDWLIADLGSRHGTFLNGQQLREGERLPLRPGDEVRFGLWACRAEGAEMATTRMTTMPETSLADRVRPIQASNLAGVAQQRLDALLEASRQLARAEDRETVASALASCTAAGTGCARVVVVRPAGNEAFDVLASTAAGDGPTLSRTLLEAALVGELVQLTSAQADFQGGQSLIDLEIRSAICAPLLVGGLADSLLYLDTRGREGTLPPDVGAFCIAMAQLGAMATERVLAAEMSDRREQLERDLLAARKAQQLLMPPRSGATSGLTYCFESVPGRFVAGDLFDLVDLGGGRTAFLLGDVAGKGVGAGLLMAAAQTQLRTLLALGQSLASSVDALNEHVHARTDTGTFLTLMAGIIDSRAGTLELVDAGHGFCCRCDPGGGAEHVRFAGGLPIGVAAGQSYGSQIMALNPGARLVLFSDGVVEQANSAGEQFGMREALGVLSRSTEPASDVAEILSAVRAHAAGPLADDVTVVSLVADGQGAAL